VKMGRLAESSIAPLLESPPIKQMRLIEDHPTVLKSLPSLSTPTPLADDAFGETDAVFDATSCPVENRKAERHTDIPNSPNWSTLPAI
ncbi:hypothetical protein PMAYCL1PPCAC_27476, partial [Pristionchus mayeri]